MKTFPLQAHLPAASRLAYGCMGLGGGWNEHPVNDDDIRQTHAVVDAALESGITFFDHADIYTFGKAEQVFGEVLKARPELRDNVVIQSKCAIRFEDDQGPKRYDFSPEWVNESVDNILRRLHCEYLDILMLHRPDPLMEPAQLAEALHALQQSGKIRHVAVSNMHGAQIAHLQHYLDSPIVANQVELSLQKTAWIDEGVTAGHPASTGVGFTAGTLEYCQLNKVQIQSWGSLCQGLFSGRDVSSEPEHIKRTAELVARLAAEYQVSREAILLAFILRHPAAIQPVIGTTNVDRIRACQQALDVTLSREHWYALFESARGEELP